MIKVKERKVKFNISNLSNVHSYLEASKKEVQVYVYFYIEKTGSLFFSNCHFIKCIKVNKNIVFRVNLIIILNNIIIRI